MTIKEKFEALLKNNNKRVIPHYYSGTTYWLFESMLNNTPCIVLYSKRPGSRLNIYGTHWFYFHDARTGAFIESLSGGVDVPKQKERLKAADLGSLRRIIG